MWMFLPIITSLLIYAAAGNTEFRDRKSEDEVNTTVADQTEGTTIPDVVWYSNRLDGKHDDSDTGDQEWNSLSTLLLNQDFDAMEGDRNRRSIQKLDSDISIISKRDETVQPGSWFYLSSKDGELSQEKKSPAFNPWGGKRFPFLRSSPKIRRPIRVPFNSWGGKRGNDLIDLHPYGHTKEKFLRELIDRGISLESLDVKRVAEGTKNSRKVPFNSWGGKRSRVDGVDLLERIDNEVAEQRFLTRDDLDENGSTENAIDEKRAARAKESKVRSRFNSWGGKRNGPYYEFVIRNETSYPADTEDNRDDDWLRSPEKRNLRGKPFQPWGGKRTPSNEALFLGADYPAPPPESSRRRVFFPWGG